MTKLLEDGIEAVRKLPSDRQDVAGEILLAIAQGGGRGQPWSNEQIEGIREARAEIARGERASPEEIREIFGDRFD